VFTTHTPVAAGHDAFDVGLFTHCFQDRFIPSWACRWSGCSTLGAARTPPHAFNMTQPGAERCAAHERREPHSRRVSARLCAEHWPEVPPEENPVGYVTNGVHVPTFLAQTWSRFFDGKLGSEWRERTVGPAILAAAHQGAGCDFWETAQHGQGTHARRRAGAPAARVRARA
jgi:glycogen phosphorylase